MAISNSFINYFALIARKTKIFLKIDVFFFVSPTDKTNIKNVISSLDSNKSVGPNSIPTKILKLLKNDLQY